MMPIISIYNYEGELSNVIPSSLPFAVGSSSSTVRRLTETSAIVRGSGYTDDEIAQTNADIETSFTGVAASNNVEYKLNWGKGVAAIGSGTTANGISAVAVDSNNQGVFSAAVTAISISVIPKGYDEISAFAATATVATISGGTNKEITAVTVSDPGVYVPRVDTPASERSFSFVFTLTPSTGTEITAPVLTATIANYNGVYPSTVTGVDINIVPSKGWTEIVQAVATATLDTISGTTRQEIDSITVTNPGLYIAHLPSQAGSSPVEITTGAISPSTSRANVFSSFTQTISNYLYSADVINAGGGLTIDAPVLTLDNPAVQAGDATVDAAVVTFSTETFNSTVVNFSDTTLTDIDLNMDVSNFSHILATSGKPKSIPKTPFSGVPRGNNSFKSLVESDSPIFIREEY